VIFSMQKNLWRTLIMRFVSRVIKRSNMHQRIASSMKFIFQSTMNVQNYRKRKKSKWKNIKTRKNPHEIDHGKSIFSDPLKEREGVMRIDMDREKQYNITLFFCGTVEFCSGLKRLIIYISMFFLCKAIYISCAMTILI